MRKKLAVLFGIMIFVTVLGTGVTLLFSNDFRGKGDAFNVVTSFYPVYIATENVLDGAKRTELVNLTENQTGCLHDYQLTTKDMKKLENADVFIINGGGMEGFIEEILKTYPDIKIINASEGIEFKEEETHEHEDHVHEGGENPHVWLSVDNYLKQIENIKNGLISADGENKKVYEENASVYVKQVEELKSEIKQLSDPKNTKAIIFHNAFAYLLEDLQVSVVHAVDLDGETSLGAGEMAEIIDEIKENDVKIIFTEAQFSYSVAERISKETQAEAYVMDSLVSGGLVKDAYIKGMKKNIEVLRKALYE